jgi:hypothetical protein
VAIGTEHPQIVQSVVVAFAIDVVQLKRDGLPVPGVEAAQFASGFFEPLLD